MVARQLNGERLTVLSWPRAILLQMAHPLIAAGVAGHSTFGGSAAAAARRAHHTIGAMLALTFGKPAEREATLARIRTIHTRIHGTLARAAGPFPAGTRYSAEDPALLLWVHATLLDSIADFYGRVVGPLTPSQLDAFCVESAPTLIALGGDPDTAPRRWQALSSYLTRTYESGVLSITPEAGAIAQAVLSPSVSGLRLPGTALHRLLTIGLLPGTVREAYGFAWSAKQDRRLHRALRLGRAARRVLPGPLARWRRP